MDRHAATLRQRHLAETAGIKVARAHPHMLRALVTAMLDAGVDLRDVQIAAFTSTGANLSMYWNTHSRSPRFTEPAVEYFYCSNRKSNRRIGAARFVSVTARRRTQIRRFWRDRYWADVGGEFLLLVAAAMI
jgi:hypothetical protein